MRQWKLLSLLLCWLFVVPPTLQGRLCSPGGRWFHSPLCTAALPHTSLIIISLWQSCDESAMWWLVHNDHFDLSLITHDIHSLATQLTRDLMPQGVTWSERIILQNLRLCSDSIWVSRVWPKQRRLCSVQKGVRFHLQPRRAWAVPVFVLVAHHITVREVRHLGHTWKCASFQKLFSQAAYFTTQATMILWWIVRQYSMLALLTHHQFGQLNCFKPHQCQGSQGRPMKRCIYKNKIFFFHDLPLNFYCLGPNLPTQCNVCNDEPTGWCPRSRQTQRSLIAPPQWMWEAFKEDWM